MIKRDIGVFRVPNVFADQLNAPLTEADEVMDSQVILNNRACRAKISGEVLNKAPLFYQTANYLL